MNTYNDLQKQIQQLQTRLDAVSQKERANAIGEIKKKMSAYGIEASELGTARKKRAKPATAAKSARGRKPSAKTAKKVAKSATAMREVRFRDPASGATWSGRGRPPRWLEGKEREQFEVKH